MSLSGSPHCCALRSVWQVVALGDWMDSWVGFEVVYKYERCDRESCVRREENWRLKMWARDVRGSYARAITCACKRRDRARRSEYSGCGWSGLSVLWCCWRWFGSDEVVGGMLLAEGTTWNRNEERESARLPNLVGGNHAMPRRET